MAEQGTNFGRHTGGRVSNVTTGSYDTEEEYPSYLTLQEDIDPSTSDESDVSRLTMEYPSDSSGGYTTDEGNSADNMSLDDNDHHGGDDHDRQDNDSLLSSLCARITSLKVLAFDNGKGLILSVFIVR
ncbi:predicted protein [Lichtheimia corymbifera JMRC:FSU:9682]|uniref:Uncharacterized protein n=1 Tax=Lichtheimia corymbifera JMRC:FSU:9682 TaxID=1263082 RepID=A0A068S0C0_9FUNG|nr:predicted protein [Lichtheimia corymbifera JMRC:FSU:9682]